MLHLVRGLGRGGIGAALLSIIRSLPDVDHQVCVFVDALDRVPEVERLGVQVDRLSHAGGVSTARTYARLMTVTSDFKPDVLHANHALDRLFGSLVARRTGVPLVATFHTISPPGGVLLEPTLLRRLRQHLSLNGSVSERLSTRNVRRFIAVSEAVRQAQVLYRGLDPSCIEVVHTPLHTDAFFSHFGRDTSRIAAELGTDEGALYLLCVGRLHPAKGQRTLIEALPEMLAREPSLQVLLAGEGPDRDVIIARSRELGVSASVHLLGVRSDIPDLLAAADLLLHPSMAEGLPMAPLEAVAAGVPIVGSDIGPLREVLPAQCHDQLVPVGDHRALADTALRLLADDELRGTRGRLAREHARQKFDGREAADRLNAVYDSVVHEAAPR